MDSAKPALVMARNRLRNRAKFQHVASMSSASMTEGVLVHGKFPDCTDQPDWKMLIHPTALIGRLQGGKILNGDDSGQPPFGLAAFSWRGQLRGARQLVSRHSEVTLAGTTKNGRTTLTTSR